MRRISPGLRCVFCLPAIRRRYPEPAPTIRRQPAWEISPEHELVRNASEAYREVLGKDAELFKMGCSTNGVTTAGVFNLPTIVCGPGDLAQAHSRDEFCSVDDLVNAVGIYARLCGLMTR